MLEKEKLVAIAAVRAAARLCEQVRSDPKQHILKSDNSPVTIADYGAQAIIGQALASNFPQDPLVAEEDAAEFTSDNNSANNLLESQVRHYVQTYLYLPNPNDNSIAVSREDIIRWINHGNGQVNPTGRYWTLDPIDGTKGFLRGGDGQYAIALALIENGRVKLGVLGCPAMKAEINDNVTMQGTLYVAMRGQGTTLMPLLVDGTNQRDESQSAEFSATTNSRVSCSSLDNTNDKNFRMVESVEAAHGNQSLQKTIAQAVGITTESIRVDSQVKYAMVASGKAALYLRFSKVKNESNNSNTTVAATNFYRENIWDHAAGAIVVEEAGGKVSDMDGKPLNFTEGNKMNSNRGVVVSCNENIHQQVIHALKEYFKE